METSLTKPEAKAASGSSSATAQMDPGAKAEPDRKVIAQELKAARQKAGLSREQARKLLGHHDKQYFYRWEREDGGKRTPDIASAIQLCITYQCPLSELSPSLWRYYLHRIEPRRVKAAEEARKAPFRREVAHRTRGWETDVQPEATSQVGKRS